MTNKFLFAQAICPGGSRKSTFYLGDFFINHFALFQNHIARYALLLYNDYMQDFDPNLEREDNTKPQVTIDVFSESLGRYVETFSEHFDTPEAAKKFFESLAPTPENFEPYDAYSKDIMRIKFCLGYVVQETRFDCEFFCREDVKEFIVRRKLDVQQV